MTVLEDFTVDHRGDLLRVNDRVRLAFQPWTSGVVTAMDRPWGAGGPAELTVDWERGGTQRHVADEVTKLDPGELS